MDAKDIRNAEETLTRLVDTFRAAQSLQAALQTVKEAVLGAEKYRLQAETLKDEIEGLVKVRDEAVLQSDKAKDDKTEALKALETVRESMRKLLKG